MAGDKADVVLFGPKPIIEEALTKALTFIAPGLRGGGRRGVHQPIAPNVRAIAAVAGHGPVDGAIMSALSQARDRVELRRRLRPRRRQIGGRARHHRHQHAGRAERRGRRHRARPAPRTVRELPQAERYLRAGHWPMKGDYRLTPSLRDRTVGIVGLGRIGKAIARRLDAMQVPVVYHSRRPADVPYRHYPNLVDMARDVDVLLVITPGGAATKHLVNAEVLKALGPERHPDQRGARLGGRRGGADRGAQGQDDPLRRPRRLRRRAEGAAGADRHGHIVLLPHVGSASNATRARDGATRGRQHHLVVCRQARR